VSRRRKRPGPKTALSQSWAGTRTWLDHGRIKFVSPVAEMGPSGGFEESLNLIYGKPSCFFRARFKPLREANRSDGFAPPACPGGVSYTTTSGSGWNRMRTLAGDRSRSEPPTCSGVMVQAAERNGLSVPRPGERSVSAGNSRRLRLPAIAHVRRKTVLGTSRPSCHQIKKRSVVCRRPRLWGGNGLVGRRISRAICGPRVPESLATPDPAGPAAGWH